MIFLIFDWLEMRFRQIICLQKAILTNNICTFLIPIRFKIHP